MLLALMQNQKALEAAAAVVFAAQEQLRVEHARTDETGVVYLAETAKQTTDEGAAQVTTTTTKPTERLTLRDTAAFQREAEALFREPVEVVVRPVGLEQLIEAGCEPVQIWPLVGVVIEDEG